MVQQHTFPLLKNSEILLCLNELGINATDRDLQEPTTLKAQHIYASFANLLINKQNEAHMQDLAGMNELEHPELHEESTQVASFLHACKTLMTTAGVNDFTIMDLIKPEYKKLRRNISAVINLAKYREEKLPAYIEFTQETERLAAQKQELEGEHERLVTELAAAEAKRNAEQPELQRLEAENAERQVKVRELWNSHTSFHKESHALKARLHDVQDATREANYKLLDARAECDELKAQIVPDPVKLKGDLVALQEAVAAEKAAIKALEVKSASGLQRAEAIETAMREVDEVLRLQGETEADAGRLKETNRKLRELSEMEAQRNSTRGEMVHQTKAASARVANAKERMGKLLELHKAKEDDAIAAYDDAEGQWHELNAERESAARMQDDNEMAVRDVRDKLTLARMEHEAVTNKMQQLQQRLVSQVRAYHQSMSSAMSAATAQAEMPVA